jgi:hypothetical protein
MEYKSVADRQLSWVSNNPVGVVNNRVACDAPVLMPDDPLAVFARGGRMVAIAVVLKRRDAI